ncbi:SUMF1/EgtB/PvdO family nonheme iron enzyme [Tateyamaria sp. syn59]|uniref:SUMF1/EgtB/PvdO family nonheme iron enzyme n=1 Tax=Tateyamaria sp. syn59 TaxID=2576942 RepID=UPI0011BD9DAE|nr:SUMF1/EgtB/PvdO family nonheme iron enzyme [Tateyamaria sp. syn59]
MWRLVLGLLVIAAPLWADTGGGLDEAYIRPDDRSLTQRLLVRAGFRELQKSYALIVGISDFDEFNDLPTAQDPLRVRDYLVDEAGFDHVHILTGDKATKDRLEELMLDDFRQLVSPDDRFLFYWSGHGETLGQGAGARGFLPVKSSRKGRFSTMVSMDDIADWDSYISARQVLYLMDSCFSGLVGSAPQSDLADITRAQLGGPARHVITAGRADEQTIAVDQLGGSVFTHALLNGLRGAADAANALGKDNLVSVGELKSYLGQEVTRLRLRFGWQRSITPQIRDLTGSDGAFFFPIPAAFTPTEEETPATPTSGRVGEVQQALIDLGYDPGDVTGVLNLRTQVALTLFQRDQGLDETGQDDDLTWRAIISALASLVQPQGDRDDPEEDSLPETVVALQRRDQAGPQPATPPASPPPAPRIRACDNCPELIRVPGGTMAYGPRPVDDPIPPITVEVAPFFIAETEVTIGQFRAYAEDTGVAFVDGKTSEGASCFAWQTGDKLRKTARAFNQGSDLSDDHPVSCVSRTDAMGYIEWLNEQTDGPDYRLPTEAEFELLLERNLVHRVQAESSHLDPSDEVAVACILGNFGDATSQFSWRSMRCYDGDPGVAIVARYPPDANGAHDLAGNLWEWVADCWRDNLSLPRQLQGCESGTLKGGSFDDPVKNTTPETRQPVPVNRRQTNIGFRVARDID